MKHNGICLCGVAMSTLAAAVSIAAETALLAALVTAVANEADTLAGVLASCSLLFSVACCAAVRVLISEVDEYRRNRIKGKAWLTEGHDGSQPILQG